MPDIDYKGQFIFEQTEGGRQERVSFEGNVDPFPALEIYAAAGSAGSDDLRSLRLCLLRLYAERQVLDLAILDEAHPPARWYSG